jgi:hypothetical protein
LLSKDQTMLYVHSAASRAKRCTFPATFTELAPLLSIQQFEPRAEDSLECGLPLTKFPVSLLAGCAKILSLTLWSVLQSFSGTLALAIILIPSPESIEYRAAICCQNLVKLSLPCVLDIRHVAFSFCPYLASH